MAHFAQLNAANIVERVIVVDNSNIIDEHGQESEAIGIAFCKTIYGADTIWRQTSYNGSIRKNYAGPGYLYNSELDAFIAPQPYESWRLDIETCQWKAPKPYPADGFDYFWNESLLRWERWVP